MAFHPPWVSPSQAAAFLDHPLPRQVAGTGVGDLSDFPGCPGGSGPSRYRSIRRNPAFWDSGDYIINPMFEVSVYPAHLLFTGFGVI